MISIRPLAVATEVTPETDLPALLAGLLRPSADPRDGVVPTLLPGDILVVTSKVVSKWLGLYAEPGVDRADLVLQQSRSVVAERATEGGVTRVVHATAGPVMAGAGIDASNSGDDRLLLLPDDADAVAARLRHEVAKLLGRPVDFAVVLSDTSGRAWRAGLTDFALGAAGLRPIDDLRGLPDTAGRDLAVTIRNIADEVAAAADLVKGKVDRVPVAVVSGLAGFVTADDGPGAGVLVRTGPTDWFGLGRAEAVRAALGVPPGSAVSARVGIESTTPEPLRERAARALRVALAAGDQVEAELNGPTESSLAVRLRSADPVALGRVWARLEAALAGERAEWVAARHDHDVTVTISQ
ncbi:coenzyme F420-0:L-glutamate ligase [Flexivirga oryzae]|uniref:Coenzyme F420-0:L-glutamate ligase/coenzyme F420-1:gamma-L-glutamate ligase n=1 Tax=Flexivirga oryzae TaxID=1794944 RepID=A0A839N424_9MICO|nr:coenzyme F420-0:L-glutamate ligase [Flexivirga oryzae]MBB2890713.1 coenzyme F420-0:L-glutamate ligase/coenzyme F420-1:gamma-L-glutamate ligase [Flexivirga oryzae]